MKTFDRVWYERLWETKKKYNICQELIEIIQQQYHLSSSAIHDQRTVRSLFFFFFLNQSAHVRRVYLLSNDVENPIVTVSIEVEKTTKLRFADDIEGLVRSEGELVNLVMCLDERVSRSGRRKQI